MSEAVLPSLAARPPPALTATPLPTQMEGQSDTDSIDPKSNKPHRNGTLAYMIFNETRPEVTSWSKNLWDPATNNYLVRTDVWVYGNENVGTGNWTVGNGFTLKKNGPE